jgi:hypothetical protein
MNYIKFQTNIPQSMVFNYNTGMEKDGKFGKFWNWGVNQGGVDAMLTATERLNEILEEIQPKGKLLEILKYEDGKKKMWKILENGQDITPAFKSSRTQETTENTYNTTPKPNSQPDAILGLQAQIKQLNRNQDKMVDKIQDLEQQIQGLYGALINETNQDAYELHKTIKLKKVEEPEEEVKLDDINF